MKSAAVAAGMRKERVSWSHEEEEALLQLYARARRDPTLRGENGLRMKGWRWLAGEMMVRYGGGKIKPVIQSKFARLMREYKLYQWLVKQSNLEYEDDGSVDMDEEAWQRIYAQRRADVSVLRRFRQQRGFPHAALCAAANNDDGVLEAVPNASAYDHDDDDDDDRVSVTSAKALAKSLAPVPLAPATAQGQSPAPVVGAKRGRPPLSASPHAPEAQRARLARSALDAPRAQALPVGLQGRLFSPELEAKLSHCLDVVTAYFEASTALLPNVRNGNSNSNNHQQRD